MTHPPDHHTVRRDPAVDVLPVPQPDARAHSARLIRRIRDEILGNGGAITFARYMEQALYAPGAGYYLGGLHKFGAQGDFVTAPEISPLFSRCLARQCAAGLAATGGGDVLEFGAGSGVMAADVLLELERLGRLPDHYRILELSGDLKARQHATLVTRSPHLLPWVEWLERLPAEPMRGVVLANEVLDAIPVHRFRMDSSGVEELFVGWEDDHFTWRIGPPSDPRLADYVARLSETLGAPLPPGYLSETNLLLTPWVRTIADGLAAGVVLVIDYGYPRREYYHPQRTGGTLMCHYRHRAHPDPLILTGLQDITAYVDFTALAEAAQDAGLEVAGFTTQAQFLLGCGLGELLADSDPTDTVRYLALTQQAKTLTLPGEMGERFKVMALTRGIRAPLAGFALRDLRDRL
ncbi:MAG: SAM-dependent methyltransferase [Chromatiales bacterium 21-64-14]|nr:MAG: SAM-dependent methyltransferase [Chromatiales bacterium 21-64-14]HQU17191.1 SAM-dependent methyltransferase [Gammaproteobacteria bacterium]